MLLDRERALRKVQTREICLHDPDHLLGSFRAGGRIRRRPGVHSQRREHARNSYEWSQQRQSKPVLEVGSLSESGVPPAGLFRGRPPDEYAGARCALDRGDHARVVVIGGGDLSHKP